MFRAGRTFYKRALLPRLPLKSSQSLLAPMYPFCILQSMAQTAASMHYPSWISVGTRSSGIVDGHRGSLRRNPLRFGKKISACVYTGMLSQSLMLAISKSLQLQFCKAVPTAFCRKFWPMANSRDSSCMVLPFFFPVMAFHSSSICSFVVENVYSPMHIPALISS